MDIDHLTKRIDQLNEYMSAPDLNITDLAKIITETKDILFIARQGRDDLDQTINNLEAVVQILENKF